MLMSGAGGKSFCAGGDIVAVYHGKKAGQPNAKLLEFFATEYLLDYSLSQLKQIEQISIWNGFVMGGGVGLTWHSPVRIATDNSMYAMPETAIGFFTDVGASYFLPKIKNGDFSLGLYLGLTGVRVKSRDLVKYGLATHYVPQENMEHLHEMLAKNVTKDSTNEDIEHIVCEHSDPSAKTGKIPDHEEIKKIFKNDSIQ
jgi:3-hydroxyisobutyryl-CoA hydrolase